MAQWWTPCLAHTNEGLEVCVFGGTFKVTYRLSL